MTTQYTSKWANLPESDADLAASPAKKGWSKKKKYAIVGGALAAVLVPSAAWAAVALFGFGSFSAAAATTNELTINGKPTLDGKLVPGQTRGITGSVHNGNDFPVSVTQVILRAGSLHAVAPAGKTEADCMISVAGGTAGASSYPAHGGNPAEAGIVFTLSAPVSIPANQDKTVAVSGVVKQDAKAEILCGVVGDYAVKGETSS